MLSALLAKIAAAKDVIFGSAAILVGDEIILHMLSLSMLAELGVKRNYTQF